MEARCRCRPSQTLLRRRVVRIPSRAVIGRVHDGPDLRYDFADRAFDSLLESDIGHATSLAASAQAEIDLVAFDVEQLDEAAVRCNGGIDLPCEELFDFLADLIRGRHGVE